MVATAAPEASESQRRCRRAKRRPRKGGHGIREEVRHAHRHRKNKGTLTRKVKKSKSMQMVVRSQPSLREEAWEDSRSKQLLYFEKRVFQMERNFANKLEAARGRAAAHDAALREQLRKADATFAATTRHQRWCLRQTREVYETRQVGPDMVIASRNPQMYLDAYKTQAPVVLDLTDGRRVSGKVTDLHWHGPEKGGTLHLRGDALPYARHQAIAYEIETRVESIRAMNEQFRACLQASDSRDCPIDEDDANQRATNAIKGVADAELYGRLCKRYSGFPDEFFVQLERPGRAFLRLIHFQAARIANWLRFWYTHRLQQREQLARMLQRLARARGAHRAEEAEQRAHKQAEEENRSRIFVQVFTTWKKVTRSSSRLRRAVERMRQRKLARVLRGWQQAAASSAARRRSGISVLFTMIMHPHFAIWHANAAQRRRQRRARHFGRRLRARIYLERWIEATVTGLAKRHLYKCKAATEIQRVVRGEWARRTTRAKRRAITQIQAWWRGVRARHEYHRYNGLRERLLRYHARRRERAREGRRHRAALHWQAARGGSNK